jgi:hypothetical protein
MSTTEAMPLLALIFDEQLPQAKGPEGPPPSPWPTPEPEPRPWEPLPPDTRGGESPDPRR